MAHASGFFGSRPAIIYLTETVCLSEYATSDVAGSLWSGLYALPQMQGVDLLAFGGDYRPPGVMSNVHDLIHADSADGFLVWRSRSGADCIEYFQRFADKPLVYLSTAHSAQPVQAIANEAGMRELVRHLVLEHGCRKIAYIGGPIGHNYADQRLAAYRQELHDLGLEPDPYLIAPPGVWSQDAGRKGVAILLDERQLQPGVSLDAIMCASDQLAMGAFAELARRHIAVPEQLKLTGFNNVREARYHFPSLTTVAMPFAQQGRRGMQLLLRQMRVSHELGDESEPTTRMVVGESCGCGNQQLARLYTGKVGQQAISPVRIDLAALRQQLLAHLSRILPEREAGLQAERLWQALQDAVHSGISDEVLLLLMPHLRTGYFGMADQMFWQQLWGDFQLHLPDLLREAPLLLRAERMIETLRHTTADLYSREQGRRAIWESLVANTLRVLSVELALAPDRPALWTLLQNKLQALEMHSCWLVLYETPTVNALPPAQARLVLAMENNNAYPLPEGGVCFPTRLLVAPGYRHSEGAGIFVSFPLIQREYEYGYLIVNHSRSSDWGETLAELVGSAIRSLHLREELARRSQQLEASYQELLGAQRRLVEADKMAALGELVAGVAHEINTPVGVGVTAVSTVLDEVQTLADLVQRRQAGPIPGVVQNLQESAAIAMRNLERAAALIESFKQIAVDQTRDEVRTFNLAQYLGDVVRSVSPRLRPGGHRVEVDCPAAIELTCDPSIIARAITNLTINSLVHGFEGMREGVIRIDCQSVAQGVVLEYRDNGCGMSSEVLEKVFNPFFTTKRGRGGTGLGMHIVYNLITQGLKGTIHCASSPGQGVCFRIVIPV